MRFGLAEPVPITMDAAGSHELPPTRLQAAVWYVVFAAYAGAVATFSVASQDRAWGAWAAVGYLAAALIAFGWRSHGKDAAMLVAVTGALIGPATWLATQVKVTLDSAVVSRAGVLLLRHGSPYLDPARLAGHVHVLDYNPYLPFMAVFGTPKALRLPSLLGDTRFWLIAVTLILLVLAFRASGRSGPVRLGVFALATPVAAFPLTVGITDPPVLAMFCLSLALLAKAGHSRRLWLAAVVLGMACAMKATAWPAMPVFAAMLAARDGLRAAAKLTAAAAGTTALLFAAFAPAILTKPVTMIQNTVMFPLGLTQVKTPAASPLPGHLLAMTGPAGYTIAMVLLVSAGIGAAVSLVFRPPASGTAAAVRLAIALTLMFALSPTTRFGYLTYPIGLLGWLELSGWIVVSDWLPTSDWMATLAWHLKYRAPWRPGPSRAPGAGPKAPAPDLAGLATRRAAAPLGAAAHLVRSAMLASSDRERSLAICRGRFPYNASYGRLARRRGLANADQPVLFALAGPGVRSATGVCWAALARPHRLACAAARARVTVRLYRH